MFKLLRHFSVMSALATAAITTVLVFGFRWHESRNLHQLAEDRNIAQAYNFANAILPKYAYHLAQPLGTTGDVLRAQPATRALDVDVRQLTRGLPVVKVKIYNTAGLTLYSSDPKQIGESKAKDAQFIRVGREGIVATLVSHRDVMNSFNEDIRGRHVAESYVGIRDDQGAIVAVFELYSDITAYVGELDRNLLVVMSMVAVALGSLYIVLLLLVRRADRILKRQYQELETFNARLEERVDARTRRLLNQQSVLSWVTKSEEFRSGNSAVALGNLTRITAATLGVARASVWIFTPERDVLRCVDLYCAEQSEHSSGMALKVEEYPRYFGALFSQESMSIDEAAEDPRLAEFLEHYLKPTGIGSMLDVPIVHGGRVEGVLCIEHVGEPIKWTAEQRLFAIAIANFASLALERQERLRVEDDLRDANRSVEAANKAKSLFLANMSHEIRTPMNGVFGMTDLLMRTELNDRQRKFVGIISSSAKRLLTIINDILDLSRIESGKLELDRHDFAFRTSVEETIDLLAGEAQRKGLDLSVLFARNVPSAVNGDSGRLRQVITNLVSNAIKFTSAGEVAVKIECMGCQNGLASLKFEVRDTGIGIPRDVQQQLFMPFQQADTSISRRFGGTGLGLSISRHLIELMGGEIVLTSEPGKGTSITFTLDLPVREASSDGVAAQGLSGVLLDKRILVLDDRATNREVIQTYFGDCGAAVVGVSGARDAYEELVRAQADQKPYSIVVVDMIMPDVNGLEFAQMVRADSRLAGTGLIMLTSLSWKGDARVARELGFGAFLTKPVHRSELIRAASKVLTRRGMDDGAAGAELSARAGNEGAGQTVDFGLRVLVAEDNPVNFEVAREYLTGMGCRVTAAENGRLAVDAVQRERFDVVLMDCQMPEMDGLTATRRIREFEAESGRRHSIIIAVTANAFAEDRVQCMEAGMDDYMSKPFAEAQLRELLARWAPKARSGESLVPAAAVVPVAADVAAVPAVAVLGAAAVAVDPAVTAKALDMDTLRRMQKTHPALVGRLVDTYLNYAPKAIQALLVALVEEDNLQLKTTAHSLKSSSANIGAMQLSGLCRTLEARLKDATDWDAGANLSAVAEIESAFQAVAAALVALQVELKAAAPAAKASA